MFTNYSVNCESILKNYFYLKGYTINCGGPTGTKSEYNLIDIEEMPKV